jgi:membrane protein involved in colicin uptake
MMKHWRRIMLALALGVAVTGATSCKKDDAAKAKAEADKKLEEAKMEADKKAAEAKAEADKAAAEAKATADKAAAERTEAKAKLQADYEAAERKATALKEKAAKATGAKKKNADAAVAELDKRWETLKADMAALDPTKGDTWDAGKKKIEDGTAEVNKAIDSLEAALKK